MARDDGATATLPPDHVAQHLTLGYAVTTHAAQGLTVDTAHALLGEQDHREQAHVGLTRGRVSNTGYRGAPAGRDPGQPRR